MRIEKKKRGKEEETKRWQGDVDDARGRRFADLSSRRFLSIPFAAPPELFLASLFTPFGAMR